MRGAGNNIKGEFKQLRNLSGVTFECEYNSKFTMKTLEFLRYNKLISLTTSDEEHLNK